MSDQGFRYLSAKNSQAHAYLLPALSAELNKIRPSLAQDELRLFDLGCGNGSVASALTQQGWQVSGVDPSASGIEAARKAYPNLNLQKGSAYDDLVSDYGRFPVVVSLEVVEHVYAPRDYAKTLFDLVETGGTAIISTPYHGYIKNLALALTGKMDSHFTALWDHGHIKFWSMKTLTALLEEAGFINIRFLRVGRIPVLAKSMIAIAEKPSNSQT